MVKIKCRPEDFEVEELTSVTARLQGGHTLYRLTKRGVGTPEAIDAIARRWNLPRRVLSFGGLKDRHAVARQHLTIQRGPAQNLTQENLALEYLGRLDRPFSAGDIVGNRFRIVMRSLTADEAERASAALAEVRNHGLPNYFDDQRFGSVGESGEFIGDKWVSGDYERALWLALADPSPSDRPEDREAKAALRSEWGKWPALKLLLGPSHRRSLVTYLCDHPADFRGAFARIRSDLRSLYLAAYQSHLWNQIADAFLRRRIPEADQILLPLRTAQLVFFRTLPPPHRSEILTTKLPLPSARVKREEGELWEAVDQVLAAQGLTLRALKIRHPRENFFSKGWRNLVLLPGNLSEETSNDELYPGKKSMTLRFDLPRGSYATILVKRLTWGAAAAPDEPGGE